MSASRATVPSPSRDRAERYLFTALPELGARERRALALAELTGADPMAIASEIGVSGEELSQTLARARKALRRAHVALPAGGRCERTERLVSDALDRELDEPRARRRDAHLARCPRCREHVDALETARTALREGFAASLTVHPTPITAPSPAAPPKLRVVPEPEPAAEPEPEPVAAQPEPEPVAAAAPEPQPEPEPVAAEPEPQPTSVAAAPISGVDATLVAPRPAPVAQPAPRPTPTRRRPHAARRVLTAVLVLLALLGAIIGGVTALDGADGGAPERAPWSAPGAPDVQPVPLSGQ